MICTGGILIAKKTNATLWLFVNFHNLYYVYCICIFKIFGYKNMCNLGISNFFHVILIQFITFVCMQIFRLLENETCFATLVDCKANLFKTNGYRRLIVYNYESNQFHRPANANIRLDNCLDFPCKTYCA